jgi:hypothetical protein
LKVFFGKTSRILIPPGDLFLMASGAAWQEGTGGPTARLAWAGARARRLWALKAKYTSTGGEDTGEGARGTGTSAAMPSMREGSEATPVATLAAAAALPNSHALGD